MNLWAVRGLSWMLIAFLGVQLRWAEGLRVAEKIRRILAGSGALAQLTAGSFAHRDGVTRAISLSRGVVPRPDLRRLRVFPQR